MRITLLLPVLLAATAATASDKPREARASPGERVLEGKVAGKPQSCLPSTLRSPSSFSDKGNLYYRINRKLVWRNAMNQCPFLRDDDILVTNLYGTSAPCRGDIAQIVDRTGHFPKGSCVYGDFVPYTIPAG